MIWWFEFGSIFLLPQSTARLEVFDYKCPINNGNGLSGVRFGREARVQFVNHEYDHRPTSDDTKSHHQLIISITISHCKCPITCKCPINALIGGGGGGYWPIRFEEIVILLINDIIGGVSTNQIRGNCTTNDWLILYIVFVRMSAAALNKLSTSERFQWRNTKATGLPHIVKVKRRRNIDRPNSRPGPTEAGRPRGYFEAALQFRMRFWCDFAYKTCSAYLARVFSRVTLRQNTT